MPSQDDHRPATTTGAAHDILSLLNEFCTSFDKIRNMPGEYIICLNPNVQTVQHAQQKVLIKSGEKIEEKCQVMVDQQVKGLTIQPTEWVSSLTHPKKPDTTLCICLDHHDLNRAIIQKDYKASTPNEITHWLNGTTTFSILDAKMAFGTFTLMKHIPTWLHFVHTGEVIDLYKCHVDWKLSQDVFQMWMDQITDSLPCIPSTMTYMYTDALPRNMTAI